MCMPAVPVSFSFSIAAHFLFRHFSLTYFYFSWFCLALYTLLFLGIICCFSFVRLIYFTCHPFFFSSLSFFRTTSFINFSFKVFHFDFLICSKAWHLFLTAIVYPCLQIVTGMYYGLGIDLGFFHF